MPLAAHHRQLEFTESTPTTTTSALYSPLMDTDSDDEADVEDIHNDFDSPAARVEAVEDIDLLSSLDKLC